MGLRRVTDPANGIGHLACNWKNLMTKRLALLLTATALFSQEGPNVNPTIGSPMRGTEQILYYTGTNLSYRCLAWSNQIIAHTFPVTAASNANPVSFTSTAHGFDYQSGNTGFPTIDIVGGTGAWAAINGLWKITPTGANTFTIPVDSTAFGAFQTTIIFKTQAPRTTQPVWAIQNLVYDGSNNLIWMGWAGNPGGAGSSAGSSGSSAMNFVCANRASLSYQ
jgi:hypothetical protein